jgi:hypothetical protein
MSPAVTSCLATCIPSSGARHNLEDNASHLLPCQTSLVAPTAPQPMPFKNEVVSDEDIDRYNLPFPKGEGRWWTRDAERDYYLWGGLVGNLAFDDRQEGRFFLYADGVVHWIKLIPGKGSWNLYDRPYIIKWECIARIDPEAKNNADLIKIKNILKEALTVYGYDGRNDSWVTQTRIVFAF